MFQDTNKDARLDQLWEIPCQLDVLAIHCYGSSSEQIPPLQEGFELSTSILGVMTSALTRAALLAPSAHLAKGGDVCKPATDTANTPGSHLNETVLKGEDLYHHVAHKAEAANSAFLPGALMAPALVQLHSRMQFLIKPKGIAEAAYSAFLPGALLAPALVQLHSRMQFLIKPKGIAGKGGAVPQKLLAFQALSLVFHPYFRKGRNSAAEACSRREVVGLAAGSLSDFSDP
eukprot:gene18317-24779_t